MKLKKSILVILITLAMIFLSACEPPDPEDVAKVIEQVSAVAYNEVVYQHPEMEETLKTIAQVSLDTLNGKQIDVVEAKSLLYGALDCFNCLDADDKRIIVDMFSIIVPLISLPQEGAVKEPQTMFMKAFFQGILNAVEIRENMPTDEEITIKLSQLLD